MQMLMLHSEVGIFHNSAFVLVGFVAALVIFFQIYFFIIVLFHF